MRPSEAWSPLTTARKTFGATLGGTRGYNLLAAALVRFTLGIGGLVKITTTAALSSLQ
ncbi:MAG: hypothetical protein QXR19_13255 [Candidatus Jordarchaeaceae archaeon]